MQAQDKASQLDRAELLKTVVTLRQEVRSMASDIQVVIDENEKLKDEVERLQGERRGGDQLAEARRIKEELDQLVKMHETATSGRRRAPEPARRESSSSAWMKKMMMFMMLADMT